MGIEYEKDLYHRMEHLRSEMESLYEEISKLRTERDEAKQVAKALYDALNEVRNTPIHHKLFRNTYELLAHVERIHSHVIKGKS